MDRSTPQTLTNNFWLRISTLCALYVAQGLPYGFVTTALKNYLHARDVSVAETGAMVAMISWPWALKFFWAPVIDRFGIPSMGRRRPWLIFAQGAAAITLFSLALVPGLDKNMAALGWAILVVNIFLSLQDVATDALAVDLLNERERGKVNGFMYGGSYLGIFIGGAVIGHFLTRDGGSLQVAFFLLGVVVMAIMMFPLCLRERVGEKLLPWTDGSVQLSTDETGAESMGQLFRMLLRAFARPVAILAAIYAFLTFITRGMLMVVGANFFVNELGWTDEAFTNLESTGVWFSLLGSIAGGFVADRIGAKRSLVASGTLLASGWIAFSQLPTLWTSTAYVSFFVFSQAAFLGLMTVSGFSMFMGIADKRVAATQFTAYMSILNFSTGTGGRIAGWVNEVFPEIPQAYLAAGLFHLAVMVFVLLCVHPPKSAGGDVEVGGPVVD